MKKINFFARSLMSVGLVCATAVMPALASSHAEAPLTSMDRFADNTDVYAFRSSEPGRENFVTLIANFIPLQDPSAGPQFFRFDDSVLYEIKIDNTGDGVEDVTYQFRFTTQTVNPNTVLGMNTVNVDGQITSLTDLDYNMPQTYSVTRIDSGSGRNGIIIASGLRTPPSNIGPRVTPNYETNLGQPAVYRLWHNGGKVFAGQRDEGFYLDLGVFDAINYRSLGMAGGVDTLRGFNVNSIAIEVPIQEITRNHNIPTSPTADDAVIGVFSTASRRTTRVLSLGAQNNQGPYVQVSRLGSPLVNEVVVPLAYKDAFNGLPPALDGTVAPVVNAVLDPEFPKIIQLALGAYGDFNGNRININIPPAPRNDIAQIFVFGIPVNAVTGPNYTTVIGGPGNDGQPHEMLRLNTAIAPVAIGSPTYSRLGLLGGDIGGFPNGRRTGDDVVDIEVRALLGGTPFTPAYNVPPNNAFGDGVSSNFEGYLTRFPYLNTPNQGNQPRPSDFPRASQQAAKSASRIPFQVDTNGNLK